MKVTKRQLKRIIKEEKRKLLRESLQSVTENLSNAIDVYVQESDEVQGYDIPLDQLKAEVMNIVDGAFEQLERDQAQDVVYS
tara:strand:+ start:301 stop:546 length:246 start_codon:yes stop_codon:yes gene_type:complete